MSIKMITRLLIGIVALVGYPFVAIGIICKYIWEAFKHGWDMVDL